MVEYDFGTDSAALKVLEGTMDAYDRRNQARKILNDGMLTVVDRYGQARAHPMIDVERKSQTAMQNGLRLLGVFADGEN